jgi:hypothetical protein
VKAPDIQADIERELRSQARVSSHKENWASDLGDPCERKLYYYRTEWDKLEPADPRLQGIFNTGHEIEALAIHNFNAVGMRSTPKWELLKHKFKLNDALLSEYRISANPDVGLWVKEFPTRPGKIIGPVEIKGFTPAVFDRVNVPKDFERYSWAHRYRPQLTIYELGTNSETGWWLLVNKANHWQTKLIELPLDLEYTEGLLQKARRVNVAVDSGEPPAKINDPDVCPSCPFASLCCPEYTTGRDFEAVDNAELSAILDRMGELEETSAELKDLEGRRDRLITKGKDILCGKWLVRWKRIEGTRKPSKGGPYTSWRKKITEI